MIFYERWKNDLLDTILSLRLNEIWTDNMFELTGYKILDKIYDEEAITTYRGMRLSDKKEVLLKIPRSQMPDVEVIALLNYEFEVGQSVECNKILSYIEYIELKDLSVVVEEFFGGMVLSQFMSEQTLSIEDFFCYFPANG